jgi:hypothetical protein
MAKTNAPLLSFTASGAIGKTQVYSNWRGVPYVRKYTSPANPKTTNQMKTRSVFTWLSAIWKTMPSMCQDPWTAYATGQMFYNRNAFIGQNVKAMRAGTDQTAYIGSPGAAGGVPPLSVAITPGSHSLVVAFTNPTAPTGWTLAGCVAEAFASGDPHSQTPPQVYSASGSAPYTTCTITGLPAVACTVRAWLKWTKPDASIAYSPSINSTGTPTA